MNESLTGYIGEIVSWTSPRSVSIQDLRTAMVNAGIDPDLAKDMKATNAFRRAIHKLEENRVIRQTLNEVDAVHFQFTHEFLSGGEFHYSKECDVTLDKASGIVQCSDQGIQSLAQQHIDDQIGVRGASDVTRIVQKLFEENGDLFPIRDAGGVYFVPEAHKALCESVEKLMNGIGGAMRRWEMTNSVRNNDNAAVAVRDAIVGMVSEYESYISDLESDDDRKMARAVKKINTIKFKLDTYKDVLDSYRGEVETAISDVGKKLERIIRGEDAPITEPVVAAEQPEDEPAEESHDEPQEEAGSEPEPEDILADLFGKV